MKRLFNKLRKCNKGLAVQRRRGRALRLRDPWLAYDADDQWDEDRQQLVERVRRGEMIRACAF